jgi:hypothetical protein
LFCEQTILSAKPIIANAERITFFTISSIFEFII